MEAQLFSAISWRGAWAAHPCAAFQGTSTGWNWNTSEKKGEQSFRSDLFASP
jgi:hypothetical protein